MCVWVSFGQNINEKLNINKTIICVDEKRTIWRVGESASVSEVSMANNTRLED